MDIVTLLLLAFWGYPFVVGLVSDLWAGNSQIN